MHSNYSILRENKAPSDARADETTLSTHRTTFKRPQSSEEATVMSLTFRTTPPSWGVLQEQASPLHQFGLRWQLQPRLVSNWYKPRLETNYLLNTATHCSLKKRNKTFKNSFKIIKLTSLKLNDQNTIQRNKNKRWVTRVSSTESNPTWILTAQWSTNFGNYSF